MYPIIYIIYITIEQAVAAVGAIIMPHNLYLYILVLELVYKALYVYWISSIIINGVGMSTYYNPIEQAVAAVGAIIMPCNLYLCILSIVLVYKALYISISIYNYM